MPANSPSDIKGAVERLTDVTELAERNDDLRLMGSAAKEHAADLRAILAYVEGLEGALKPFSAVSVLMDPLVAENPERWTDDKPNHSFTPSEWPRWGDFKAARAALQGAEHG